MKAFFRAFVAVFVALYRWTGGRVGGTMFGIPVLIVTMTGRKTGKRRVVPLGYVPLDGGYVVVASESGGKQPGWFYNLQANAEVSVELKRHRFHARAELLTPELREQVWPQVIASAPAYGRYEKRPTRDIPVFMLKPNETAADVSSRS